MCNFNQVNTTANIILLNFHQYWTTTLIRLKVVVSRSIKLTLYRENLRVPSLFQNTNQNFQYPYFNSLLNLKHSLPLVATWLHISHFPSLHFPCYSHYLLLFFFFIRASYSPYLSFSHYGEPYPHVNETVFFGEGMELIN